MVRGALTQSGGKPPASVCRERTQGEDRDRRGVSAQGQGQAAAPALAESGLPPAT